MVGTPASVRTPKGFWGGTHRTRPPHETLAWLEPKLAAVGITRVADITGLDHIGVPVALAIQPNARSVSTSQGKGLTLEQAKVSAIMEAVETHHAEVIDGPVRLGSYRDLIRRVDVVDPALLPRPRRSAFGPDLRLPWIEARGLRSGQPTWVPFELVDLDFTVPDCYPRHCFAGSSNGLASGNEPIEATVHALCEIVERDAHRLWDSCGDHHSTRMDLATVDDVACRGVLDRFDAAGVEVAAWDATSDVGIPVFVAVIADRSVHGPRRIPHTEGFGAHPHKGVALLRALNEAAQSRLTLISGSRDDQSRTAYQSYRVTDRMAIGLAALRDAGTPRSFDQVVSVSNDSFDDDVGLILDRFEQLGIPEPLTIDLTRPDVGVPVVKVIVPTMEPAPDMPVRAGPRLRRLFARVGGASVGGTR